MEPEDKNENEDGRGAGSWGLAGYEYQIDVSVWLALDLVLATKQAAELILEPASQEDAEADVEEDEPGRITTTAVAIGYKLVVQAKRRTGNAWTPAAIKRLLQHGSATRPSAAARLKSPDVKYLLVTSAGLNDGAKDLNVRRAGVWPKSLPSSIGQVLPADAARRVAIIGTMDEERLAFQIQRLLTERFRVPFARWQECLKALREEARIRILNAGSGKWRRAELEAVIRKYDGYLADSPELEHYVHPTNWKDLRAALSARSATIIVGQSGTGKTMATKKVYAELREEIPGLTLVKITQGPAQLAADTTPSPVLYDIEDPWGRFDFDPDRRPWNDLLPQFFARATHDRMIIATSRLDVALAGKALEPVKRWAVRLESEDYGPAQRRRLYRTRILNLPRDLQMIAREAEGQVLSKLETPLEIQKFFDALPSADRTKIKNRELFVGDAIAQAHRESIEHTVVLQIEERDDVCPAAVIWALMKAGDKISLKALRDLEEDLAALEPRLEEGVSPLVNFMVAARNVRQVDDTLSYYHPRVEAGLERVLKDHALVAKRTLQKLINALVAKDRPGEAWGAMMAARIVAASSRLSDSVVKPSKGDQTAIDAWLEAELLRAGSEFDETLRIAEVAGSDASTVSELARWLLHRPDRRFPGFMHWKAPQRSPHWKGRMRADPATRKLAERFIRDYLARAREDYDAEFVDAIQELAPNLVDAFLDAAQQIVHWGYVTSSDTIAQGALQDLSRFEAVVHEAIRILTPSEEEQRTTQETRLAIINDEYSEDYAEHLSDNDDGYTADDFLKQYVHRVRQDRGWQALRVHRYLPDLLPYWLGLLADPKGGPKPTTEELEVAFPVGLGSKREDQLWSAVTANWDRRFVTRALERATGGGDHASRLGAVWCLLKNDPSALASLIENLASDPERLLQLSLELDELKDRRGAGKERDPSFAEAGIRMLPAAYAEIANSAGAVGQEEGPSLSDSAINVLRRANGASEETRNFRIAMDSHVDLPVDEDIRWILGHSDERNDAVEAIEAAVRRDLTSDIAIALDHRFAHVAACALEATVASLEAPFPETLLQRADAKGSPIRRVLATALGEKPHDAHLPTLMKLVRDQWSKSSRFYDQTDTFEIAAIAVKGLEKFDSFPPMVIDELFNIAEETSDPDLKYAIFQLLGQKGDEDIHRRLLSVATSPGKTNTKICAASGLLGSCETVDPEVAGNVSVEYALRGSARVVSQLLLVLTWRARVEVVISIAGALAANPERRALILLMVHCAIERDPELARKLAAFLPPSHRAVNWALGQGGAMSDADLADLGDPASVAQVLHYLPPMKDK